MQAGERGTLIVPHWPLSHGGPDRKKLNLESFYLKDCDHILTYPGIFLPESELSNILTNGKPAFDFPLFIALVHIVVFALLK